ncbi:cupin domain-containing protein [Gemmobacter nectariphilus]|uniref:cupin domain-containing protein n=1 Tax=Gemmobacter nectariphilus TaxID=220343 RepID=UPI00041F369E|nr:cupin domain-containing protein [Gemmobacter nectariphilus]
MTTPDGTQVMILTPKATSIAKQGMPAFFGVSQNSTGAQHLSLNLTAFGPGGRAKTHFHRDYETAIYTVSGAIVLLYGNKLEHEALMLPGSFTYIPPEVPHIAFNLSLTEPATAVTARNDAREQENVVLTPDLDGPWLDERIAKRRAEG